MRGQGGREKKGRGEFCRIYKDSLGINPSSVC